MNLKGSEKISSPCIGVCKINSANGICEGCNRTLDEISDWIFMKESERNIITESLKKRDNCWKPLST